jgi:hypothetical protein
MPVIRLCVPFFGQQTVHACGCDHIPRINTFQDFENILGKNCGSGSLNVNVWKVLTEVLKCADAVHEFIKPKLDDVKGGWLLIDEKWTKLEMDLEKVLVKIWVQHEPTDQLYAECLNSNWPNPSSSEK